MRIAALSDFHIGARDHKDEFRHTQDGFLKFLDQIEAAHDRVVLLGDIYQCDHAVIPNEQGKRKEIDRARERMPRLAERLGEPQYTYVHGNHDVVAGDHLGALESLELHDKGFGLYFVHGHQFDPVIGRVNKLARAATWTAGRLRAARMRPVAHWLETRDVKIKHKRFGTHQGPYCRAGRGLLMARDLDVVVMGHTHVAARHELPEGIVANTGTCSGGRRVFVSIDTDTRAVTVRTLRA
ncbi:MAG: metallophosphoesterase family protein [Myxococcales bacterium]|nr:metallophosphoesterase family protein [Myxococcales bacterium]MCB9755799.1 metallophosphoesterase family protein [Myxococcales bacterium]